MGQLCFRKCKAGKQVCQKFIHPMGGFTFLGLLMIIAIMSIGLLAVSEVWNIARKREKEQELLFVGHQFRQAISLYSTHGPRGSQIQIYPMYLEDMLKDPRYPSTRRYLRKIYTDPLTGSSEWGLLKNPNGSIYGVYSLSEDATIKRDNFDLEDASFKGKEIYSDWKFIYTPPVAASGIAPASGPAVTN